MTEASGYRARRELRAASRRLTQLLVFGYGIGAIVLAIGSYNYLFAAAGRTPASKATAIAGAALLLLTLAAPFAWALPERLLRRAGNWIGHGAMTIVLVIVYFAFFWPVGALLRRLKGPDPVYEWRILPPPGMEGWRTKELPPDVASADAPGRGPGRIGLFTVLAFFARRGHYLLIPALLVLVSLGIALFFLQTSALAPFIYTLF